MSCSISRIAGKIRCRTVMPESRPGRVIRDLDTAQLNSRLLFMKLLDDIISLAAGETGSASTLLRKCLVLAHTLSNDRLKAWAENELNGYPADAEIPDYRKTPAAAKGFFIGSFGGYLNDQPIPPALLRENHRHFAESAVLFQPVAAYEEVDGDSKFVIDWPANLIVLYQGALFGKRYVLNRAWQEIPGSVFIGLIDSIKTRVLRFALDLQDDLRSLSGGLADLPKEKIDQSIVTYILGTTVNISGGTFHQSPIGVGDNLTQSITTTSGATSIFADLYTVVNEGSIEDSDRKRLIAAIEAMERAHNTPSFRDKYREFIALAADYMTLVGPYVPALASLLGKLTA
jgi:hypothetical protein